MNLEQMFTELQPDPERSAEFNRGLRRGRDAVMAYLSELAIDMDDDEPGLARGIRTALSAHEAARNG